MTSRVDSFKRWAEEYCRELPAHFSTKVSNGGEFEPDQYWLRIEVDDGPMGILHYWEIGSADATVFDGDGNQIFFKEEVKELGNWEKIEPSEFDTKFVPFTRVFKSTGKQV